MSDPVLSFNERRRFKYRLRQFLHIGGYKPGTEKAVSKKRAGPIPEKEKPEADEPQTWRLKNTLACMAVVVAIIFVGSHFYANYRHNQDIKKLGGVRPTTVIATAKQEENRYKKADDQNLKSGDLESYQVTKLTTVNGYLLQKDFNNAQRVLDDIKKNIPKDKLQIAYFVYQLQVDENNKDSNAQKSDLASLIALLKSAKSDLQASIYQQKLDTLNGVKKPDSSKTQTGNKVVPVLN